MMSHDDDAVRRNLQDNKLVRLANGQAESDLVLTCDHNLRAFRDLFLHSQLVQLCLQK